MIPSKYEVHVSHYSLCLVHALFSRFIKPLSCSFLIKPFGKNSRKIICKNFSFNFSIIHFKFTCREPLKTRFFVIANEVKQSRALIFNGLILAITIAMTFRKGFRGSLS